ncbi:MAG: hypothetical protein PHN31_04575 [Candidatus Gracilibacteria bacterium]|nr:hypothetical protein [Candidatus Gracilibacteria bacterium]
MFAFELGREYKLSIAEIYALFPEMEIIYFDEKILIINNINTYGFNEILRKIGGTIKVIKIEKIIKDIPESYEFIQDFFQDKKNNYSINIYGLSNINQKETLLKSKKAFSKNGFSTRFVNQDFHNIKSYQITKEKLVETKTDFNIIKNKDNLYIGYTIYVQDINAYSKRDFGKKRDMIIGMLPPKLAQIMINLSGEKNNNNIYDPFCGLGTILLESIINGEKEIYGSDLNNEMIIASKKNIEFIKNNFNNNLKKSEIIQLDAKKIATSSIFKNQIKSIITEGYLGEIFGKTNIDLDKVKKQRNLLSEIYENFFAGLKKVNFSGHIVISFPFREIKGKYNYFEEIYEIINKYCHIENLLPKNIELKPTKSGSLLYKRPDQTVGREIFKLKIK